MSMIKLYELAGAEAERRFSPFCWRVRLALCHKELPFETVPWRFTEKQAIAFSGQGRVPVMVDGEACAPLGGGRVVHDSWAIAEYLEATYRDRPSLFGGPQGKALSRFVSDWVETVLHPRVARLVYTDVYAHLHEKDQAYFRQTREAKLGMTLEAFVADREQHLQSFHQSLAPLKVTLQRQPFLAGEDPAWADYIVFSAFQWARCISPLSLLEAEDLAPVALWCERLLTAFNGEARNGFGYSSLNS
jgi:glutathione S-transferase